jgi:elongation factor Ts
MIEKVKKLRQETNAGVLEIKQALEEVKGDLDKARKLLQKRGVAKAIKKAERETKEGLIHSYIHANGKVGAMLELQCETDFVARTEDFAWLARELGMQIASMNPLSVDELLSQDYIRDPKKKIEALIKETIAKLGENIRLVRFVRYELGSREGEE